MTHTHSRFKRSTEAQAETDHDVLDGGLGPDALPPGTFPSADGSTGTIFPKVVDVSETHIGPVSADDWTPVGILPFSVAGSTLSAEIESFMKETESGIGSESIIIDDVTITPSESVTVASTPTEAHALVAEDTLDCSRTDHGPTNANDHIAGINLIIDGVYNTAGMKIVESMNPFSGIAKGLIKGLTNLLIKNALESIDDGVDPVPDPNIPVVGQAHDPVTGSGLELA